MRAVQSDGEVKAHDMTALLLDQKSLAGVHFSVDNIFWVGTTFHDDLTDDVDNFLALQDTGMCASLNHPHTLPTLLPIVIVIVRKRNRGYGGGYSTITPACTHMHMYSSQAY